MVLCLRVGCGASYEDCDGGDRLDEILIVGINPTIEVNEWRTDQQWELAKMDWCLDNAYGRFCC